MKKQFVFCMAMLLGGSITSAQQPATVREYKQSFPTYPFSDPNPVPLLSAVYPYFRYDGFTDKPIQKEWKVIELENDFIKLLILPEIGGKIWAAIEKSSGRPFIYYNHAVKFRDIAMRGPWTSGGLEANYGGIMGHTPNCATPVDYAVQRNEDGSVSCTIGVLDLLSRSNWRMEIRLPKDKAWFSTKSFWYNATSVEQPYYHWMNAGLKASGNLEFIYPGNRYIGHNGEAEAWPINKTNGKNQSFYEQNDFGGYKSYHVFGKYTGFSGAYWHDDDLGMVRYGTHDDKAGKKIWIWGLSRQGMIWEKLLTDTDGQYVELQSGRLFNQNADKSSYTPFKHRSFAPYATDTWTEYWYPVHKTKGMVEANEQGALNVQYEKGWLKIYFSPAASVNDQLIVKSGETTVYTKNLQLSPLQTFADSIQVAANADQLTVTLGTNKLQYQSAPQANVLSRPVTTPADFDWTSTYGLYLLGKEAMDQKRYPEAEELLQKALKNDHNYFPALVKMAALLYRNLRYTEALELITRALSIDTHAGDANYYYGLINTALGNTIDAKDGFDLATLSTEYRSAAYTELSKIYLRENNADKALGYAAKAVDYNRFNIDALQLQAVIYRQQKQTDKHNSILTQLLSMDILNHFTGFEKYLRSNQESDKQQFSDQIRNELPVETYLELGIWYYNAGQKEDAVKVFAACPASVEASYWLAFLQKQPIKKEAIDLRLAFPFRSETAGVIEALRRQQSNWFLDYHLALIYLDRNRKTEAMQLLNNCGNSTGFAPLYAVRAALNNTSHPEQAAQDLQLAASIDPQWRYQKLLAEHYIRNGQNDKALPVTERFYKANPRHYIMGMLYAKALLLNKRYAASDAVLSKLNIIPFEGATDGRELYREAKLMQAVQAMQQKNYKKAIQFISQAKQWPENLGVGKPYEADIDTRLEDFMSYQCNRATGKNDAADQLLQQIIRFEPRIDNTVSNFQPANTFVTAWAYRQLQQSDRGTQWLNEQAKQYPDNKILHWSKALFEENQQPLPDAEKNANVRILEALKVSGVF
ncbi:DUF5107 domain-containing protein [Pseudoflavitalea sp. G-6-1-2]|uniref:DUF5107 domain-containing protein n=1 Tax=Pseudoflavitalea sp. G-6-1-2 TaxID=2728841 RepID=UPI00146AC840|nr:DUF5107 domain-containing protein [Pseudoflavitalea sp. G-6-1-2]NML22366.1 DUF5107 domain-containing protein [Pseudoflavitalea sp. G-6-1-2]